MNYEQKSLRCFRLNDRFESTCNGIRLLSLISQSATKHVTNNRNLFSHNSERWTSEVKVLARQWGRICSMPLPQILVGFFGHFGIFLVCRSITSISAFIFTQHFFCLFSAPKFPLFISTPFILNQGPTLFQYDLILTLIISTMTLFPHKVTF